MPIITTETVAHYLDGITVDMQAATCDVRFRKMVNGNAGGEISFQIAGEDFAKFLSGATHAGMNRGEDVTQAVYEHAVAAGHIVGEIA